MLFGILMYFCTVGSSHSPIRRDETFAIRWENTDFANNEINVQEAVVQNLCRSAFEAPKHPF